MKKHGQQTTEQKTKDSPTRILLQTDLWEGKQFNYENDLKKN